MTDQARLAGRAAGQAVATKTSSAYRRSVSARTSLLVLVTVLACIAMLADLVAGSGTLSLSDVLTGLFSPQTADPTVRAVIWSIRAPMTVVAAFAGIELAVAGSLMQTALNNPLAEPFTLGISSAAAFGAAVAIVFQTSIMSFPAWMPAELFVACNAFVFALLAVILIAGFSIWLGLGTESVTLIGIAVHFTFSALLAFAQYVADPNQLQSLIFWLLGSLLRATWLKADVNGIIIVGVLPLVLLQAWALTSLRGLGDEAVVHGIRVHRLRMMAMIAAAMLAAAATATIGIVGFIGLVAPQIARLLVGEDQRFALLMTAALGALLLTTASLASKLIVPGVVLPIGMLTSLFGVPFFLLQIVHKRFRRDH